MEITPAPMVASAKQAAPTAKGNSYSFTAIIPCVLCTFQIATPISIASSNAVGLVNSPKVKTSAPNVSSIPESDTK